MLYNPVVAELVSNTYFSEQCPRSDKRKLFPRYQMCSYVCLSSKLTPVFVHSVPASSGTGQADATFGLHRSSQWRSALWCQSHEERQMQSWIWEESGWGAETEAGGQAEAVDIKHITVFTVLTWLDHWLSHWYWFKVLLYHQDLYVERLTKDKERLMQQIAMYEAQAMAQAEETQAVKEALCEVTMI